MVRRSKRPRQSDLQRLRDQIDTFEAEPLDPADGEPRQSPGGQGHVGPRPMPPGGWPDDFEWKELAEQAQAEAGEEPQC